MLVLNLPFKALMFLTLMRPSLVLFLVLWLKLVKDFLKVRCRLALLPFLISCLIWLDLVASLPLIRSEERFSRNAETDLVCRLLLEKKKRAPQRNPVVLGMRDEHLAFLVQIAGRFREASGE